MVLAKFIHVVSFSSEDQKFPAENLLAVDSYKKWKCKDPGSKFEFVVLQLEKASKIHSIEIGNENSAFIEVSVCRSGDSNLSDYQIILPASSFMTPLESRNDSQINRVRIFETAKLSKPVSDEKWDRIKFNCMQPFNKQVKYGLSFVRVNLFSDSDELVNKSTLVGGFTLNKEALKDSIGIGSYFAKKDEKSDSASKDAKSEFKKERNEIKTSMPVNENFSRLKEKYEAKKKVSVENTSKTLLPKASATDSPVPNKKSRQSFEVPKVAIVSPSKPKKAVPRHCPFAQLMSDVVFCISGFQNPLRSTIRDKALHMGAKYKGDWGSGCTHLICAFANTPKYNQVKSLGKIVTKEWVEDSYKDKIRYPWKRYSIDKLPDDHAEEEVYADEHPLISSAPGPSGIHASGGDYFEDTDEEVERILQGGKDDYQADTNTADSPMDNLPCLPDILINLKLYVDPSLDVNAKETLGRLINALGGTDVRLLNGCQVDFILSEFSNDTFRKFQIDCKKVKIVKPSWILECAEAKTFVDPAKYLITS